MERGQWGSVVGGGHPERRAAPAAGLLHGQRGVKRGSFPSCGENRDPEERSQTGTAPGFFAFSLRETRPLALARNRRENAQPGPLRAVERVRPDPTRTDHTS